MRWLPLILPTFVLLFAVMAGSLWGILFAFAACVLTFAPLWDRLKQDDVDTKPIARGIIAFFAALLATPLSVSAMEDELEKAMQQDTEIALQEAPVASKEALQVDEDANKITNPKRPIAETVKIGSSIYEQAIFDAFPESPPTSQKLKKKASQASDFLAATINTQGYLCARPMEALKAADEMYGVGCVTNRNGYGRTNYIINTRSGEVSKI